MILFMGVSGAGKGTQSHLLAAEIGYAYLSTGDMLRQFGTSEQKQGMLAGKWLNDDEIITMVNTALASMADPNKSILDGFPRTSSQALWLIDQSKQGRFSIEAVIDLIVSPGTVFERLHSRGRSDDTDDAITHRLDEYKHYTQPLLDLFKENKIAVYDIDGSQVPDTVNQDILMHMAGSQAKAPTEG